MANVLNISEAASMAMHTVVLMACDPCRLYSTNELASIIDSSEAHLSKVLQRLTKSGIIESMRGPKGGYRICEGGRGVTLLDVYEAIEGPLVSTDCLLKTPACIGSGCILGGLLNLINVKVRAYLSETRVIELAKAMTFKFEEIVN